MNIHKAFSQTDSWIWAKSSFSNTASSAETTGKKIITDTEGYIYVAGIYNSADIGFDTIALLNGGGFWPNDIFILKYTKNGDIVWAKRISGTGNLGGEELGGFDMDANGNLYLAGSSTSHFLNIGGFTLTNNQGYNRDIFVCKMNKNGEFIWAKRFGGAQEQIINCLAVESSGNFYIGGIYNSVSIRFGKISLTNATQYNFDAFVTKFDSSGIPIWAKNISGPLNEGLTTIATDDKGSCYISGYHESDTTYINQLPIAGGRQYYCKLDTSGKALKAFTTKNGSIQKIITDDEGNQYIGGYYDSSQLTIGSVSLPAPNLGGYSANAFIIKLDTTINPVWGRYAVGYGPNNYSLVSGICSDKKGHIYISGTYTADSLQIGNKTMINPNGFLNQERSFITKMNDAGAYIYSLTINNSDPVSAAAIASDMDENILITGNYSGRRCEFGNTILSASNNEGFEVFIAKLSAQTVGMTELIFEKSISIYPNPSADLLQVDLTNASGIYQLYIYDECGKLIQNFQINSEGIKGHTLDMGAYASGLYYLKISNETSYSVVKFSKL